jgi:hypothetical protein
MVRPVPGMSPHRQADAARRINVNGSSWTILRDLGLRYELHPLALEDALHMSNSRSKTDYYRRHSA